MAHDETKIFSGHLLDIMGDKNEFSRITGIKEADFNASITEAINNTNAAKNSSQGLAGHIESMTEGIMDKGIIFGHAGDASAEIISSLEQSGTPISNDVLLNTRTGSIATTGHTSDVVVINNYMDRKAVDIAGKTKDLEKAEEVIVDIVPPLNTEFDPTLPLDAPDDGVVIAAPPPPTVAVYTVLEVKVTVPVKYPPAPPPPPP
jgi:hypothetical protein